MRQRRGGGQYQVAVGAETLAGTVHETGEWGIYTREHVGEIEIAKPGRITISVKALSRPGPALMNLKLIEIQPAK
jgi:arylsulfatase A